MDHHDWTLYFLYSHHSDNDSHYTSWLAPNSRQVPYHRFDTKCDLVTTTAINVWGLSVPADATITPFTFPLTSSVLPPPFIITNDRNPENVLSALHPVVTRTITPPPFPWSEFPPDPKFPVATFKPPLPGGPSVPKAPCVVGCGKPCFLFCRGPCLLDCGSGEKGTGDFQDPEEPNPPNPGSHGDSRDPQSAPQSSGEPMQATQTTFGSTTASVSTHSTTSSTTGSTTGSMTGSITGSETISATGSITSATTASATNATATSTTGNTTLSTTSTGIEATQTLASFVTRVLGPGPPTASDNLNSDAAIESVIDRLLDSMYSGWQTRGPVSPVILTLSSSPTTVSQNSELPTAIQTTATASQSLSSSVSAALSSAVSSAPPLVDSTVLPVTTVAPPPSATQSVAAPTTSTVAWSVYRWTELGSDVTLYTAQLANGNICDGVLVEDPATNTPVNADILQNGTINLCSEDVHLAVSQENSVLSWTASNSRQGTCEFHFGIGDGKADCILESEKFSVTPNYVCYASFCT